MSIQPTTELRPGAVGPTLEVVWQDDATALVLTRGGDGELSAGDLRAGMPAIADLPLAGRGIAARRLEPAQLIALAESPPDGLELGASARAVFAVVELARRSVTEGLVHPFLDHGDGWWHAFWGATLDESIQAGLAAIATALPPVGAGAFDGDAGAAVNDLYPVLVDQIARDCLRAERVRLAPTKAGRASAIDHLLEGLTAADSVLPRHSGLAALESGSRTGSTAGSRPWPVPSGASASISTSAPLRTRTKSRGSRSSSGCRRATIRPSASPRRCSGTATATSLHSCALVIRAAT